MAPKDTIQQKSWVIYWFRCSRLDCDEEYIGESYRTYGERYREYLKVPSLMFEHQSNRGYNTTLEESSIVDREGHSFTRSIKETLYIIVYNPTPSRDMGKYNLPHMWDRVLYHPRTLGQQQT